MHTNTTVALKSIFYELLVDGLYFLKYTFSSITLKIYELHNEHTKRSAFIFLVLNAVFITVTMLKLSRTTSPHKLFPSDCITL